jgi:hypothetical protein
MKRVFTDVDPVLSGFVESLLVNAGIECTVRNRYLGGGAGELPLNECWPEIWVLDDDDAGAARRIIERALEIRSDTEDAWTCAACGERLEGQFAQCWKCGATRD